MNIDKSLIGKTISDIQERFSPHTCCNFIEIYFTDESKTTLETEVDYKTQVATISCNRGDLDKFFYALEEFPAEQSS